MNTPKTYRDYSADNPPQAGDRVLANGGYSGTIVKVHTGQLHGMVDVRLPGGLVTIDICDLR